MSARHYQPSAEDAWRVAGVERWRWDALRDFAAEHPAARWYVQARTPRACAEGPAGKIAWYVHGRRVVEKTSEGRLWLSSNKMVAIFNCPSTFRSVKM